MPQQSQEKVARFLVHGHVLSFRTTPPPPHWGTDDVHPVDHWSGGGPLVVAPEKLNDRYIKICHVREVNIDELGKDRVETVLVFIGRGSPLVPATYCFFTQPLVAEFFTSSKVDDQSDSYVAVHETGSLMSQYCRGDGAVEWVGRWRNYELVAELVPCRAVCCDDRQNPPCNFVPIGRAIAGKLTIRKRAVFYG